MSKFRNKNKESRLIDVLIEKKIVRDYFLISSKVFASFGVFFLILAYAPSVYYSTLDLFGRNTSNKVLIDSATQINPISVTKFENYLYQPQFDKTLSDDNILTIPSVGIKTTINEALDVDFEQALQKGVWRVSTFGTPYMRKFPTILVAHRFGYLRWSVAYRLKNSFYNLPKVKAGEKIEIVWLQRKYVYEVYKTEEGNEISDYSANLILYTCRDLSSVTKVFVYAKLLEL